MWKAKTFGLKSKIRLLLVLTFSIFLYAWESWILTAELQAVSKLSKSNAKERLRLVKISNILALHNFLIFASLNKFCLFAIPPNSCSFNHLC